MKSLGIHYDTIDIYEASNPTFLSKLEDFDESCLVDKYNLVCAFQMLEHSPYEQFVSNLEKMVAMSDRYVFISLPYSCWGGNSSMFVSFWTEENIEEKVFLFLPFNEEK